MIEHLPEEHSLSVRMVKVEKPREMVQCPNPLHQIGRVETQAVT
jgi:hypothetical protein